LETKLNDVIKNDEKGEVFGAPVLSASTNSVPVISDPDYNPVAKANPTTRLTAPVDLNDYEGPQFEKITTSNNNQEGETGMSTEAAVATGVATGVAATSASLMGILIIMVVLVVCCFGCGTLLICGYRVSVASQNIQQI